MISNKRLLKLAERNELKAINLAQKAAFYREAVAFQEEMAALSNRLDSIDEFVRRMARANRT